MDLKSRLKELKKADLNCNLFHVYDYDELSMQELLCQFFNKINECVEVSNDTLDLASWLVNEGLEQEVVKKLLLWYEDGTLEQIINKNLFESLNNKIDDLYKTLNDTKVDGIAFNVKSDFMGLLENHIKKIKEIGATGQMVVFASVDSITSTNVKTNDVTVMNKAFEYVKNNNLDVSLMKVHLVCNFNDGSESYRTSISPPVGQEQNFFDSYKNALIFYLNYCVENNINKISIANENSVLVREGRFLNKWKNLINDLKTLYPNILLSYSMNSEDILYFKLIKENNVDNMLNYLDYLSFNIYPRISSKTVYDSSMEKQEYIKTLYKTNIINTLSKYHSLYNKDIIISEIGCTHKASSLNNPLNNVGEDNEIVQGVYYDIILNTISKCDFVKGTYIWNVSEPFTFYNTTGEIILKNHFKGVK